MSWDSMIGHDACVDQFRRRLQDNRMAHAYLFAGPEGIGKCRFAVALAKAMLCETNPLAALDACDMRAALILIKLRKGSGAYPADLSGIRPEWTIDPFSGQPFVYRKDADGILLYSVGENLKDDGGDAGRHRRSGLDIVYPLKNR